MLRGVAFYLSGSKGADDASEHRHGGNPEKTGGDPAYFFDNDPRRSRRTGEATQTAQTLAKTQGEQLQRQRDDMKKLQSSNIRLRRVVDSLKQECDGLKRNRKFFKDRYEYVLDNAVRPYTKLSGVRFTDKDNELVDATKGLYEDAMEAKDLRAHVQKLQGNVSPSRSMQECVENLRKMDTKLREQIQSLQRQNRALLKESQLSSQSVRELSELREEVRSLQKENRALQKQSQISPRDVQELNNLREQVNSLQMDALAKVDRVHVVPDTQFAQDFRTIVGIVKGLSRSVQLSNETEIFYILDAGCLLENVPTYRWSTRAQKKAFIEAWTWSVLIELVFRSPFTMFQREGEIIRDIWSTMFDAEGVLCWPAPSLRCELWRRSTMEQLVEATGRAVITHGNEHGPIQMAEGTNQVLQKGVLRSRIGVIELIHNKLSSLSPGIDILQVQNLADKAFTLALNMSLQRSRLQITFPTVNATFDTEEMTAVPDRNGRDIEEGTVAFVVNPGLTKWGDAEGRKMDCRYDIVASLVQVELVNNTKTALEEAFIIIKPEPIG